MRQWNDLRRPGLTLSITLLLSCVAQAQTRTRLLASDGAAFDQLGIGAACRGARAVAGAPLKNIAGKNAQGAAYVFRYDGTQWFEEQQLIASNGVGGDEFGWSCAMTDDVILVGARWALSCQGAAYVYRHNGTSWVEEQILVPSDGTNGNEFGTSCAMEDGLIVIGAPRGGVSAEGAVYVYRYVGTTWVEEQKLLGSHGKSFSRLGTSCDVDRDVIVAGAEGHSFGASVAQGMAYAFRFNGTTWVEETPLIASDGASFDSFGSSCGVSGDAIAIGAQFDSYQGYNSGSGYLFEFQGSGWVETSRFIGSDSGAVDEFGSSCSMEGNALAFGASWQNGVGAVYAFRQQSGGTWPQERKVRAPGGQVDDRLGWSCGISGNLIAAGVPCDDVGANSQQGSLFLDYGLSLLVTPAAVTAGANIELQTALGQPLSTAMLAVVALNGAPLFVPLRVGQLDAQGAWSMTATVPPGLAGNTVEFLSFARGPSQRSESSNLATLLLE